MKLLKKYLKNYKLHDGRITKIEDDLTKFIYNFNENEARSGNN